MLVFLAKSIRMMLLKKHSFWTVFYVLPPFPSYTFLYKHLCQKASLILKSIEGGGEEEELENKNNNVKEKRDKRHTKWRKLCQTCVTSSFWIICATSSFPIRFINCGKGGRGKKWQIAQRRDKINANYKNDFKKIEHVRAEVNQFGRHWRRMEETKRRRPWINCWSSHSWNLDTDATVLFSKN